MRHCVASLADREAGAERCVAGDVHLTNRLNRSTHHATIYAHENPIGSGSARTPSNEERYKRQRD